MISPPLFKILTQRFQYFPIHWNIITITRSNLLTKFLRLAYPASALWKRRNVREIPLVTSRKNGSIIVKGGEGGEVAFFLISLPTMSLSRGTRAKWTQFSEAWRLRPGSRYFIYGHAAMRATRNRLPRRYIAARSRPLATCLGSIPAFIWIRTRGFSASYERQQRFERGIEPGISTCCKLKFENCFVGCLIGLWCAMVVALIRSSCSWEICSSILKMWAWCICRCVNWYSSVIKLENL